jgi:hypothetical protein
VGHAQPGEPTVQDLPQGEQAASLQATDKAGHLLYGTKFQLAILSPLSYKQWTPRFLCT